MRPRVFTGRRCVCGACVQVESIEDRTRQLLQQVQSASAVAGDARFAPGQRAPWLSLPPFCFLSCFLSFYQVHESGEVSKADGDALKKRKLLKLE